MTEQAEPKLKFEKILHKAAHTFHLVNGTTVEGRVVQAEIYNLMVATENGAIWLPKHSLLYAELRTEGKGE